jgi:hypothetical protein
MSSMMSTVEPAVGHAILRDALEDASRGETASLSAMGNLQPVDQRDELLTLLYIHDLHLAPIDRLGPVVRFQHHPAVSHLKDRLEAALLSGLQPTSTSESPATATGVVAAMRGLASAGLVPPIYQWIAERADIDRLWVFLAMEGGPDGGFDDLVAIGQVGLSGEPKLEMARNYWDEMGCGSPAAVHTELHRTMITAGRLETVAREDLPVPALERLALGSVLATNRWLQPELVGALGLLELQAGPRCRKVSAGLRRLGAPPDMLPFYDEHALTDPRHGKDWLDHVVAPLAEFPRWAAGMLRGAQWRAETNNRFFDHMAAELGVEA